MAIVSRAIPIPIDPLFDAKKAEAAIATALDVTGGEMVKKLGATVSSWQGKPAMVSETNAAEGSVTAGPEGEGRDALKWAGVDQGTPPHPIVHRRAPFLQFPWQGAGEGVSYQAATRPRRWSSGPHRRLGPRYRTYAVSHPGIYRPREWSDQLAVEEGPKLAARVQAGLDKVIP